MFDIFPKKKPRQVQGKAEYMVDDLETDPRQADVAAPTLYEHKIIPQSDGVSNVPESIASPRAEVAVPSMDVDPRDNGSRIENSLYEVPAPKMMRPMHPEDEADPYIRTKRLQEEGASKNSLGKRILQGALRGLAGGGIGGALLGAAVEGASPGINRRLKTQQYLSEAVPQIAQREVLKQNDLNNQYRQAQIDDIPINNDIARERITEQSQTRQDALTAQAASRLAALKTFDPKNPAHVLLAKRAGKTDEEIAAMKGWDYSNPVEHKIDGDVYKLNRTTGEYEPSGLPTNEREKLVNFDAVDADGKVVASYKILPEKAASLAQSMRVKNLELKARADLQNQRIGAASTEKQKERDFKTEIKNQAATMGQDKAVQRARETFTKIYSRQHKGKVPSQDEMNNYLNSIFPPQ
jgi:hypothetical protein